MVAFKYERRIRHGREGIDRSEGIETRKYAHQFQTNDNNRYVSLIIYKYLLLSFLGKRRDANVLVDRCRQKN